jgi:hypothetical protein
MLARDAKAYDVAEVGGVRQVLLRRSPPRGSAHGRCSWNTWASWAPLRLRATC